MRYKFKYFFSALLILTAILAWSATLGLEDRNLNFYALDVGQGDAIFIETPSKNQILIDGGPDRKVLEELGEVMPFWDRTIDVVILTHPHLDHAGGLVEVLKNYQVKVFADGGDVYGLAEYQELKNIILEKNIKYIPVRRGIKMVLDRNAELVFIAPDKIVESKNPHDNSVISRLSFGEIDFLLMGDAEKGEELELVQGRDNLESEVLKIGHHCSKTSSNPLFLEKVKPRYALISVGAKNRYGHPAQETLSALAAAGAKIFRTDVDSRIHVSSDGTDLTVSPEK